MIELYSQLVPLEGESYNLLKKLVIYSLYGNSLKHNGLLRVGNFIHDTRINFALSLRAGYGKSTVKWFVKRCIEDQGYTYSEPTSLHPEQLVGKVFILEDGSTKTVMGYLADDYVAIDEALELLINREMQYARDYINTALDPIGLNEISKRPVGVPKEEMLKYCPNCTILIMFHPIHLKDDIIYRGFFRRMFLLYINPSEYEREKALAESLFRQMDMNLYQEFINHLKALREWKNREWRFTCYAPIVTRVKELIKFGFSYSAKVADVTDTMWFTLRDRLMKMAAIQAAINGTTEVNENHVYEAYKDLKDFWESQCYFAEDYVLLTPQFVQRQVRIRTVLNVLVDFQASPTNPILYEQAVDTIRRKLSISFGLATSILNELISQGIVAKKQIEDQKLIYLNTVNDREAQILQEYYGIK